MTKINMINEEMKIIKDEIQHFAHNQYYSKQKELVQMLNTAPSMANKNAISFEKNTSYSGILILSAATIQNCTTNQNLISNT